MITVSLSSAYVVQIKTHLLGLILLLLKKIGAMKEIRVAPAADLRQEKMLFETLRIMHIHENPSNSRKVRYYPQTRSISLISLASAIS